MKIPETIVKNVELGLVLDGKGNWVPLAQLKAIERTVLNHLEAGEVLHEGTWTSLEKLTNNSSGALGAMKAQGGDVHAHEAAHISNKKAIPWVVVSCNTGEQHLAHENMLPLIRQSGASDDDSESAYDLWENAQGLPLKKIAFVAAGIVALAAIVVIAVKILF